MAPERASVLGVLHGFAVSLNMRQDHGVLAGLHEAGSVAAACGAPASQPLLALAMLHDCGAVPVSLRPVAQLLAAASHLQSLRELLVAPRSGVRIHVLCRLSSAGLLPGARPTA